MIGQYTVFEWLLFFYTYSFLGWVFESCYVSIRKKRWVNRGFLKGPFLPIYGGGNSARAGNWDASGGDIQGQVLGLLQSEV